jgi:hypothetical protein
MMSRPSPVAFFGGASVTAIWVWAFLVTGMENQDTGSRSRKRNDMTLCAGEFKLFMGSLKNESMEHHSKFRS